MSNTLRIEVLVIKDSNNLDTLGHILITPSSSDPQSERYRRHVRILRQISRNGDGIPGGRNTVRDTLDEVIKELTATAQDLHFATQPVIWRETDINVFNLIFGLAKDRYDIRRTDDWAPPPE